MTNEFFRTYCFSLPSTTEEVKWEHDLCFMIGAKMYCVAATDGTFGVSFKCSEEDFNSLLERDGIIPAPYLARNKWVKIENPAALSKREWEEYLKKSYKLVSLKLTRKVKMDLGLID